MSRSAPTPVLILELAIVAFVMVASLFSSAVIWALRNDLSFDQFFNLGEGVLWLAIATVILVRTIRSPAPRRLGYGAAVSFALFGLSDSIEIRTGAWYSPWPLLALKAACVVSLLGHLRAYRKSRAQRG